MALIEGADSGSKRTPAQRYYFNGRVYYSYDAYARAVAAYQERLRQSQRAAAEDRARQMAQQRANAQSRAQRQALLEAKRQAQTRLASQQAELRDRELKARTQLDNILERRRTQELLARRRRVAWEALRERTRRLQLLRSQARDPNLGETERRRAEELIRRSTQRARIGGLTKDADATEFETKGDQTRIRLLTEARESGDYEKIFRHIRRQQRQTGGRYLDSVLYDQATNSLAEQMTQVRDAWQETVDEFYRYFEAESWDRANALVASDEFRDRQAAYIRFFGDGRKPGLGQRLAALQQEIAESRDRFIESQIIRPDAQALMSAKELQRAHSLFRAQHLRQSGLGRGGLQEFADRGTAISLQEWLRREDERERAKILEAYQRSRQDAKLTRDEGLQMIQGPDGSISYVRREAVLRLNAARRLLVGDGRGWKGVLSEGRLSELLGMLSGTPAEQEEALRALMQAGTQAFRQRHPYLGVDVDAGKTGAAREFTRLTDREGAFRAWLYETLTGQKAEDGVVGALQDLSLQPVSGDVLNSLGLLLGGTGSLVRMAVGGLTGGGQLRAPDLFTKDGPIVTRDADGKPLDGYQFLGLGVDRSDRARQESAAAFGGLLSEIGDPNEDIFRRLSAIRLYGQDFVQGDLSLLYQALLDPLTFNPAARFLRGGRLALARAGGAKAAALAPRASARDFLRLSLPERLGGLSPARIADLTERMAIARGLGRQFDEVAQLSAEDLAKLAQETMTGSVDDIVRRGVVERLLEASPARAQQIVAAVSEEFKRRASRLGRWVDPQQFGTDVRYARNALRRVEREAAAETARKAALADEALQVRAASQVRGEIARTGAAPAVQRVAGLSPQQQAARTRLVRQYEAASAERMAAVTEAKVASEALEATRDRVPRQQAYRRFEDAVRRLRAVDESPGVAADGSRLPSVIERHRRALEEFDANTGFVQNPGFAGLTRQRVAADFMYATRELRVARQRLSAAVTPGQVKHWKDRIRRLEAARTYFRGERDRMAGISRSVRATVRQYKDQANDLIRPQQVAAKALDDGAARAELARDLHVAAQREVVDVIKPLSARERRALTAVETHVAAHLDLAGIDELDPLVQRFGAIDELALADAVLPVEFAAGAAYDVQQRLRAAVSKAMRQAGMQPDVERFIQWRQRAALTRPAGGWRAFRALDARVQTAIRSARGWIAKGTIRVRRGKSRVRLSSPDPGLTEIYAKVAVLSRQNVSVFAYDQARHVLRKPMLKHNRGVEIRNAARRQVAHTGGDLGETFDALREAKRGDEVVRNLEEYASRPAMRGLTPEEVFAFFEAELLDQDLRPVVGGVSSYQAQVLANAFREVSGATLGDSAAVARALAVNAPPLDNWGQARQWLVDNGVWSPRTADDIRVGKRVWSVSEERTFWQAHYGVEPSWLEEGALTRALESKDGYDAFMRETGRYNDEFERLAMAQDLTPEQVREQIEWGGNGIERARTYSEIRQWMIDRYGELVADAGGLVRAPWLMDPRALEYRRYLGRVFSDTPAAKALRASLGIEFDEGLVKAGQVERFGEAVEAAVDKRLNRLLREGKADFDDAWLPQEQNAFVFDIVDHLMADPVWRGFLERQPPLGRLLGAWGSFWRGLISWTLAFPVMNLIDAYGLKRLLLAAVGNDFRPLSLVSREAREAIPDLKVLGFDRSATWYTRGRNGFVNMVDSQFSTRFRLREGVRGVYEVPLRASRVGEERLIRDFARARFDAHLGHLRTLGVSDDAARVRALAQAAREARDWFPGLEDASTFERALNQIIPFLSYNLKNKVLSISKFGLQNPWLLLMADRLARFIEEVNRDIWADLYGDTPFNADDPRARRLWIRVGDNIYTVDLSGLSDWTRGVEVLFESQNPADWATEFFRVPHPSQAIGFAAMFGFNDGKSPWGTPVDWGDMSVWGDLAQWFMGTDAFSPENPKGKDAIQILSQLMMFKAFGRISPINAKVAQFFAFMDLDEDRAWAYYRDNPDIAAWFALDGADVRPGWQPTRASWFNGRSPEERRAFDTALAGYERLKASLDAKLDQYYLTPWSAEYRAWKRTRRALLAGYLKENPILAEVWAFGRTPAEFAAEMDEWLVDDLVDRYFAMDEQRPSPDDFDNELDYQRALNAWFDMRQAFLEANPAVYDRLHHARNAVERAWYEQELQWSEVLDRQADVRIRLLEEEAKSAPSDAAMRALHALSDANYLTLDAEAFGSFYDLLDADLRDAQGLLTPRFALPDSLSSLIGRARTVVAFPGRGDYFYSTASPQERRAIDRRDAYIRDIKAFVNGLKDPRLFWSELEKRPELLRQYLRRNPEREADYRYASRIGQVIRSATSGKHFYELLERDPWLKAEYFRRHPEKKAQFEANQVYISWMGRWVAQLKRDNFVGAQDVWDAMPAWVKDRYFAAHPESGMRDGAGQGGIVGGQAYYASMGRWVNLLREKRYDEADRYFHSLPDWMREKYFAKHPDQRARFELDSRMLRLGAEYFLARGDDKLKVLERAPALRRWLADNGGDEAAMRGLIQSAYRAIPAGEEWLRRKFRDTYPEVFGQEAAGERRLASVARDLAENPDLEPFYWRALALQQATFIEQLRRSGAPPKPLHYERKRRLARRRRRRAARFASHWSLHRELRLDIRSGAG